MAAEVVSGEQQYDLTSVIGGYLDRHLVFPMLEFLSEKKVVCLSYMYMCAIHNHNGVSCVAVLLAFTLCIMISMWFWGPFSGEYDE